MKKHILVVSQYFYPEQFRINDICQEWVKRGFKVTVLTGIPNYPQGKFYEGFGFCSRRYEKWKGIEIIRIPLIPRGNNSAGLVLNYLSFPISGFIWNILTKIKADYVFNFETSPMTQSLIAVWYAKKYKIPCYVYVQDLWPDNVEIITGIHSPLVIRPIEKMVKYIYKNCNEIFATSHSFVEEICNKGVSQEKVHYWPQYAEEFYKKVENKEIKEIPRDNSFKIIFTGNIGKAQGLEILPQVAKRLKNVKFIILGDGRWKDKILSEIKKLEVEEKFILIERQPAERIPEMLACCDVAFVSFMKNEIFTKTIPAKLQSYMACGMPILAAAAGETERIIREAKCGICGEIGDIEALYKNIQILLAKDKEELVDMGIRAKKYSDKHFKKSKLMDDIETFFR